MIRTMLAAGVMVASLGLAGGASAQVCEVPGTIGGVGGDYGRGGGRARGDFGRGGGRVGGDFGRGWGRVDGRPGGRGYGIVEREVIIPAEYRIVERQVWVEPIYEYRTREVWVPRRRGGRKLQLGFGQFTVGVNLGKRGHGHGRQQGYYQTVTEKVLVQPGYYRTVRERVLVRPERVEIVSERLPIRGGFGKVGVRY